MSDERDQPTPELASLEARLRRVRFEPRHSFGAELVGRMRRGEAPRGVGGGADRGAGRGARGRRTAVLAGLTGLAAALLLVTLGPRLGRTVTVDRCCFDLDGGGLVDDGVRVVADRRERVRRLEVYEDGDGSGGWTPGDVVRFTRGPSPVLRGPLDAEAVTTHQCCLDYDGGGADDDGLMVVRTATDRVVMAAIYDTRVSREDPPAPGWPLR